MRSGVDLWQISIAGEKENLIKGKNNQSRRDSGRCVSFPIIDHAFAESGIAARQHYEGEEVVMNGYPMLGELILPLFFVVGGLILGLIFERIILARLKRTAARTKWQGDEIIIASMRGMTVLWFLLAGIYWALESIPIDPLLLSNLQKIWFIVAILSVTWAVARIATGFVNVYSKGPQGTLPSSSIFTNFTRLIVFLLGILVILQSFGISITPVLTALGIGGLAVALALQDTLSNLFSGLQILASGQIKQGDYIKLDTGDEGFVTDITWRNTTIKTLPNNLVIVPNSKLASAIVTNFNLPENVVKVYVNVGVSYNSDLGEVERVTMEVAKEIMAEIPGGIPDSEPAVRYQAFGDSSIDFTVVLYAEEFTNQYIIKHEFIKRLHERFMKEDIEIPFPIRTVYVRGDGK